MLKIRINGSDGMGCNTPSVKNHEELDSSPSASSPEVSVPNVPEKSSDGNSTNEDECHFLQL